MGAVLSNIVLGLSLGLILFLLASGLTLTMGLMRIINLAHGALFMVGGFVGWWVARSTHNFWLGILAGAVVAGLIGLFMETAFLRRLYGQPTAQVLLSIGFIYMLVNITQWIWSATPAAQLKPGLFNFSMQLGSVKIPVYLLFIIEFGVMMAMLLWLLQEKTRVGAVVRAGMDNREIAGALGINLRGVFTGVFVLGAFVAGGCGWLGAITTGVGLGVAWNALLLSMIVVVVGGTGSIQGALVGGILLGLLNSFGAAYFPNYAEFVSYVALIVILLVKPSGLLGRAMVTGAAASQYLETPAKEGRATRALRHLFSRFFFGVLGGLARMVFDRRRVSEHKEEVLPKASAAEAPDWLSRLHRLLPALLVLLVLLSVPPFIGWYQQGIWSKVLIFAMFAMSLDLTMGYTGLVSFGHTAFLGVAGYTVAIVIKQMGVTSFWVAAPLAMAVTAVTALIIAFISLRVSGNYYLLVTMALGQVLCVIAGKASRLTNGIDGLVGLDWPDVGFHVPWNSLYFYYVVLVVFAVCYLALRLVVRSSFGKSLEGIRLNEQRMRSLGFDTWQQKFVAILVGGLFAGVAGILYAYNYGNMMPQYLGLEMASMPMLMVIMGGRGTLWGPCLGAAAVTFAKEYTSINLKDRWPLILGAIFVACVVLLRGGFARHLSTAWDRWGILRWGGFRSESASARPAHRGADR